MAKWTKKELNRSAFVKEGDIREIIEVTPPTAEAKAALTIAGPKGGSFRMPLPDWFWNSYGDQLHPGDGLDNGGWIAGKFVEPAFYTAG